MSATTSHRVPRVLRELSAIRAFILRDADFTKRYLGWDIVWLIYNVINACIMGYIGLSSQATPEYVPPGQSYLFYMLIGAVMWSYLGVLFYIIAETVAWERWEGTLEYTFMAPVHRLTHLIGVCVFAVLYGVVRIVLMLAVLAWVFRLDLSGANILSALVALTVASFSMIGLGLMAAVLPMISPEKGVQGAHIILAVILCASGVYYPITVLPEWLQLTAFLSPVYWALIALRKALLEGTPLSGMLPELGALLLTGIAFVPLGYFAFCAGERWAKKTGLLKRSG
jgi:ABC-2 type transport system permease protein